MEIQTQRTQSLLSGSAMSRSQADTKIIDTQFVSALRAGYRGGGKEEE